VLLEVTSHLESFFLWNEVIFSEKVIRDKSNRSLKNISGQPKTRRTRLESIAL